jgi:TetR/AcrR family transcriptional repressor of nem operon
MEKFWAHGYEATGVQALCEATGLNAGSIYAAFGDKRGLFIAALKQYMNVVSTEAIERLNRNPSGLAAIKNYFKALVDGMVDGKRQWGCLVTNSVVESSGSPGSRICWCNRACQARRRDLFGLVYQRTCALSELHCSGDECLGQDASWSSRSGKRREDSVGLSGRRRWQVRDIEHALSTVDRGTPEDRAVGAHCAGRAAASDCGIAETQNAAVAIGATLRRANPRAHGAFFRDTSPC